MKKIILRIIFYVAGLFIVTLGIASCIKSGLGVSPVTSIPYTLEKVAGISTGTSTIYFYMILLALQIILLRKKFNLKNLLQIPVAVLFGYFTDFSIALISGIPTPTNIVLKLVASGIGIILVAIGMFFYVPADIVPLPPDGFIKTVSELRGAKFSNIKIIFDVTVVTISFITCLLFLRPFNIMNMSVGLGTVLAAIFVGLILGFLNKHLGTKRDLFIK